MARIEAMLAEVLARVRENGVEFDEDEEGGEGDVEGEDE